MKYPLADPLWDVILASVLIGVGATAALGGVWELLRILFGPRHHAGGGGHR